MHITIDVHWFWRALGEEVIWIYRIAQIDDGRTGWKAARCELDEPRTNGATNQWCDGPSLLSLTQRVYHTETDGQISSLPSEGRDTSHPLHSIAHIVLRILSCVQKWFGGSCLLCRINRKRRKVYSYICICVHSGDLLDVKRSFEQSRLLNVTNSIELKAEINADNEIFSELNCRALEINRNTSMYNIQTEKCYRNKKIIIRLCI